LPVTDLPVGVAEQKPATPTQLAVSAGPNPFGGRTQISYSLPRTGDVSLVVYDAAGRPVQTLASGRCEPGRHSATWDAKNAAAGVYFYTLTSGKASITRKLILAD
jgi:flagellar hook assembly protein FlgD